MSFQKSTQSSILGHQTPIITQQYALNDGNVVYDAAFFETHEWRLLLFRGPFLALAGGVLIPD